MHAVVFGAAICGAAELPSVSIMLPTNSRPEFVRHALAAIARQDYASLREVIIVDDSPPELRLNELARGAQRHASSGLDVIYSVHDTPLSIGAKRNIAANLSTGEVRSPPLFTENRAATSVIR